MNLSAVRCQIAKISYSLKSNVVSRIYATEVDAELPADTFFPELDDTWRKTSEESHAADNANIYPYIFAIYEK